jgi:hypothetical protein
VIKGIGHEKRALKSPFSKSLITACTAINLFHNIRVKYNPDQQGCTDEEPTTFGAI